MDRRRFVGALSAAAAAAPEPAKAARNKAGGAPLLFRRDNLVAWCIVPFDAKHRGPEERAAMLAKLGLKKFVYDWRAKDIPDFDREIDALNRHSIHLQGFWTPLPPDPAKPNQLGPIYDLLRRRKLHTELWLSIGEDARFKTLAHEAKRDAVAGIVAKVAADARTLGCKVGLYNHGGWYGEPENQIEVLQAVKATNTGIIYNFHHGHEHMARFPELMKKMLPHLLAVNINGMKASAKIVPLGSGTGELAMLKAVKQSGYRGPIGILGHREELDAEEALTLNLKGLQSLLPDLGEAAALKTYQP